MGRNARMGVTMKSVKAMHPNNIIIEPFLEIDHLSHAYDGMRALDDVSLRVESGAIVCLLGASGSGKTTLLRVIAGLEEPTKGTVRLGGRDLEGVPTHRRGIGLMFQDLALFPHLSVADNIAFGLRMGGIRRADRDARVASLLTLIGLPDYGARSIAALSGGERQRVALARSLAPQPQLLLLDEPTGSLDAALRERLAGELRTILKTSRVTSVYVTHDQREAFTTADQIAIMDGGQILQMDAPERLYRRPTTIRAARFLGLTNILPVNVWKPNRADTPIGSFAIAQGIAVNPAALLLHPDGIALAEPGDDEAIVGIVEHITFTGETRRVVVRVAETLLNVRLSPRDLEVAIGDVVRLYLLPGWAIPLSP